MIYQDRADILIRSSIRHRNYQHALFISLQNNKPPLLTAILYYELRQYRTSLVYLKNLNTRTAKFYEYLNYRNLKEHTQAVDSLAKMGSRCIEDDDPAEGLLSEYIIDNDSFINDHMGDAYTAVDRRDLAINSYSKSFKLNEIYTSFIALYNENCVRDNLANEYFIDRIKLSASIRKVKEQDDDNILDYFMNKYSRLRPGLGDYFLADMAKELFEIGRLKKALSIFDFLTLDEIYITHNLNYLSSLLWQLGLKQKLNIICNYLNKVFPSDPITFTVLGNYYSLVRETDKSISAFSKGIQLMEDPYTFCLIGQEAITKCENNDALLYFKRSLDKQQNNYNAMFGIALVNRSMERFSCAQNYLALAVKSNPHNPCLKLLLLRYLCGKNNFSKALDVICDLLGFNTRDYNEIFSIIIEKRNLLFEWYLSSEFGDIGDSLLSEIIKIYIHNNLLDEAEKLLKRFRIRGSNFQTTRKLLLERFNDQGKDLFVARMDENVFK